MRWLPVVGFVDLEPGGKQTLGVSQRQDRSLSRINDWPGGEQGFRGGAHHGLDKMAPKGILKNKGFLSCMNVRMAERKRSGFVSHRGNGCLRMMTPSTDIFAWKRSYRSVAELLLSEKQNFCSRAGIPLLEQGFSTHDPQAH